MYSIIIQNEVHKKMIIEAERWRFFLSSVQDGSHHGGATKRRSGSSGAVAERSQGGAQFQEG